MQRFKLFSQNGIHMIIYYFYFTSLNLSARSIFNITCHKVRVVSVSSNDYVDSHFCSYQEIDASQKNLNFCRAFMLNLLYLSSQCLILLHLLSHSNNLHLQLSFPVLQLLSNVIQLTGQHFHVHVSVKLRLHNNNQSTSK